MRNGIFLSHLKTNKFLLLKLLFDSNFHQSINSYPLYIIFTLISPRVNQIKSKPDILLSHLISGKFNSCLSRKKHGRVNRVDLD